MTDEAAATQLSPDEAFAVLGNETRVQILQALGGARDPLSFSAVRDRVGMVDSGQFNYHLDRLTGHFVRRNDDGYELTRAGGRVVEAVLSGAVTEAPVLERTEVAHPCHYCGAPVEIAVREERVELYCTECPGTYGTASSGSNVDDHGERTGYLGYHPLPPAGVQDRSPEAVLRASFTWGHLELLAASSGLCPRCSATLDREKRVCEDHDADEGLCEACGRRHAVAIDLRCTNCIYAESGAAVVGLACSTALLAFVAERGLNPVSPPPDQLPTVNRIYNDYEEELLSTDPFEARFTFTVDDDALSLTVDDDLTVVDVTRA